MAQLVSQFLLISLCTFIHGLSIDTPPVVQTNNGYVSGSKAKSMKGREYKTFTGIPFAQPPIFNLRFKPPMPVKNWVGILDATRSWDACPQLPTVLSIISSPIGSEDCLYLNVFTPKLPGEQEKPLPVLFYVHGGAYVVGTPLTYGPQRLMDLEVVVVTASYRLGALGFLCTGDSSSPGNYGALDQVEALKWVQKNIRYFGGDPNRVVVFGESSGGSSVSYLPLYPGAEGLFQGVIAESGSAFAPWAFKEKPLERAKKLATYMFCPSENTTHMIECLRNVPAFAIVLATTLITEGNIYEFPFVPCAEDPKTGLFLRGNPIQLFLDGKFLKVPTIVGSNRDDGAIGLLSFPLVVDELYLNYGLKLLVGNLLPYEDHLDEIVKAVRDKYFKNFNFLDQISARQTLVDLVTDAWFRAPAQLNAQLLASQGVPTFVYSFEYEFALLQYVTHGLELNFLFNLFGLPLILFPDLQMSSFMTGSWVSFASNSSPAAIWQPTELSRDVRYLRMTTMNSMQQGLRTSFVEFWNFEVPRIAGRGNLTDSVWNRFSF